MPRTSLEIQSALRILDTSADAILTIDVKGTVCLANAATEQIFGYTPEELLGQSITCLMPKQYAQRHSEYVQSYLKTGLKTVMDSLREVECIRKDGSPFSAALTVREFVRDNEPYFIGVVRDITERKKRQTELEKKNRELQQSNDMLARFAYISAHDLKTPLRSITGLINNFVRTMDRWINTGTEPDPERVTKAAKLISHDTAKMSTTIDDTLRYCQAGENLKLSWCSLDKILVDAIDSARALIEEHHVNIDKEKANIKIYCDKTQLTQVFYNLITNAIKYNDKDYRSIRIEAYKQGTYVMVHVQDNGVGIPEDQQHKVFELFQKLQPEGSGVGGAIVDRIVKGHGGTVSIDSVIGQGSTFNIKLPIKDI